MTCTNFCFLAPNIGFILFPTTDNSVINISIETKEWTSEESLTKYIDVIDESIYKYDELKVYNLTISWNKISVYIELLNKKLRDEKWLKKCLWIRRGYSK